MRRYLQTQTNDGIDHDAVTVQKVTGQHHGIDPPLNS
jgi:hypothetical protein